MTLGVELLNAGVIAVGVDEHGRVAAQHESAALPDSATAAHALLERLGGSSPFAIASVDGESPKSISAVASLADRCGGQLVHASPMASGTAAAMAEGWVGAAQGLTNIVFLSAAEQTSAGILRDGMPMNGAGGRAPAIGWLALNPVEREDYRKIGCLEAEVGAAGIVRRLVLRIKSGDESSLEHTEGGLGGISLDHVLRAARSGDGVAISVIRDTARYLGMAAGNLVAVADPEVLVLGGIMSSAADLLFEPVRAELIRRLPGSITRSLAVVPASLGAIAPAIGAARWAAAHRA